MSFAGASWQRELSRESRPLATPRIRMNMTAPVSDRIEVIQGDITKLDVDAIVNAANTSLLGGGGVDGAIHRAAGPGLVMECRMLNGCRTGEARVTGGYRLPARWVIHTVGPVWQGGNAGEDELLASCYRESLKIARDKQLHTVAFPAISTGVYRFPVHRAARIAARETAAFLAANPLPERVMLVCFGADSYTEYLTAVQEAV
jgi:O-acetyl-ADP-ribose deacetylase (regulator of RNase III)